MLPRHSIYDSPERGPGDVEFFGYLIRVQKFLRRFQQHEPYRFLFQFCVWICGADMLLHPMLITGSKSFSLNRVLGVFNNCSNVEVIWIAARRVITFMKHPFTFRDFTEREFPCNAVRFSEHSIFANRAISMFIMRSRPWPTFIWISGFYALPKSFGIRFLKSIDSILNQTLVVFRRSPLARSCSRSASFLCEFSNIEGHSGIVYTTGGSLQRNSCSLP